MRALSHLAGGVLLPLTIGDVWRCAGCNSCFDNDHRCHLIAVTVHDATFFTIRDGWPAPCTIYYYCANFLHQQQQRRRRCVTFESIVDDWRRCHVRQTLRDVVLTVKWGCSGNRDGELFRWLANCPGFWYWENRGLSRRRVVVILALNSRHGVYGFTLGNDILG